jgi:hypothetical protein
MKFGSHLRQDELVSLTSLTTDKLNIKFDQDARRWNIVLTKWFEENWALIKLLLCWIIFE